MNVNQKCQHVFIFLGNLLGVLPLYIGFDKGNIYFISKLTRKYIITRLLLAIFVLSLHIKVRIYDRIKYITTSFYTAVYIGCSTSTLMFAIGIVFTSIVFYGKSVVKLAKFFTHDLLLSEKASITSSSLHIREMSYIVAITTSVILLSFFEYTPNFIYYMANLCIDLYTEMVTHIWVIAYFNLFHRLELAFKDLYFASLEEVLDVKDVNKLWKRYLHLRGISVKISRVHGLNVMFLVGYVYIWELNNGYEVLSNLIRKDADGLWLFTMFFWITMQGIKLFVLVHQAPKCMRLIQRFRIRMVNYRSEENHIEEVNNDHH